MVRICGFVVFALVVQALLAELTGITHPVALGFIEPAARSLELALPSRGVSVGGAQVLVGGSVLPFGGRSRLLPYELGQRLVDAVCSLGDLAQAKLDLRAPPRTCGGAGGEADVAGLWLEPAPSQGAEAKAAVGCNPAFGLAVVVGGAGEAFEQACQLRGVDAGSCRRRGWGEPRGERGLMGLALQPLGVVHGRCAVGPQQATIGGDPGVEEPGGLKRGFKAGTLGGVDMLAKIDQLPQRRTGQVPARLGAAVGDRTALPAGDA